MKIELITLEGEFVTLKPLHPEHLENLYEAGSDESLWLWTTNVISSPGDMKRYVETALEDQRRGVSLPFVTVEKSSGKIVGSTRFGNIDANNRRAEIGWTWINPHWQ